MKRGFGLISILIGIAVIVIVSGGSFYYLNMTKETVIDNDGIVGILNEAGDTKQQIENRNIEIVDTINDWQTYFIPFYNHENTSIEVSLPSHWIEDNSGGRAGLRVFIYNNYVIWFNLGHGHFFELEHVISTTTINGKDFRLIEYFFTEDLVIDGEINKRGKLQEKSVEVEKGFLIEIFTTKGAMFDENILKEFDQIISTFKFIES